MKLLNFSLALLTRSPPPVIPSRHTHSRPKIRTNRAVSRGSLEPQTDERPAKAGHFFYFVFSQNAGHPL